MATEIPLTGSINAVTLSPGYTLLAPGMKGRVKKVEKSATASRGSAALKQDEKFTKALDKADAMLVVEFEINTTPEAAGTGSTATRAAVSRLKTALGEPAMRLTTPKPRADVQSVLLYTDDSGESRWIWPEAGSDVQNNHFHLPRTGATPPKPDGTNTRGTITKGIRRVVKLVSWATDSLVGRGARALAQNWEEKNRPYGFHAVQPDAFGGEPAWDDIGKGQALLLLHGTFSTGQSAFDGLIRSEWLKKMNTYYGGRIFAFNHPSLHHTPEENVRQMLDMLPASVKKLDLDIVTHSRGGLVGRELCQRASTFHPAGKNVRVRRAVFVAGPHAGTILTDAQNWRHLIDAYTNLLTDLPDNPYTITMEGLLTLIKIIGAGALDGLPGLQSMLPGGEYLKGLNAAPKSDTAYYALAAQYVLTDDKTLVRIGKELVMKALRGVFNEDCDLVVPTRGCYEMTPSVEGFSVQQGRHMVYDFKANINHLNFFQEEGVNKQLHDWLCV